MYYFVLISDIKMRKKTKKTEAKETGDSVEQPVSAEEENPGDQVLVTENNDSENNDSENVNLQQLENTEDVTEENLEEKEMESSVGECDNIDTNIDGKESLVQENSNDDVGEEDADDNEEPSQDNSGDSEEIEGVIENPLFEPEQDVNISSIEKFSMDAIDDDDLDFEPDIEEANDQGKSSKSMESECRTSPGREENDTAGTKDDREDDEGNKTIDEIVISDTDDIDELGDKIDAAYPGQENKKKLDDDDDESDEEKRGWRSEKGKDSTRNKSPVRRRSRSPIRRRRVSPPRTRISRRRSRYYFCLSS